MKQMMMYVRHNKAVTHVVTSSTSSNYVTASLYHVRKKCTLLFLQ